eukprot:2459102-Pyramimonas_sp.AAC.1
MAALCCFSAHPFPQVQLSPVIGSLQDSCASELESCAASMRGRAPFRFMVHKPMQAADAVPPACLRLSRCGASPGQMATA